MKTLGLYKKEKLCSTVAIDMLFGYGGAEFSRLCYPLRLIGRQNPSRRSDSPVAFLISVPKKRLRHAVDRVKMRRRIREAYRLNHLRHSFNPALRLDIAFVYVAKEILPYGRVEAAMSRLMQQLSNHYTAENPAALKDAPDNQ